RVADRVGERARAEDDGEAQREVADDEGAQVDEDARGPDALGGEQQPHRDEQRPDARAVEEGEPGERERQRGGHAVPPAPPYPAKTRSRYRRRRARTSSPLSVSGSRTRCRASPSANAASARASASGSMPGGASPVSRAAWNASRHRSRISRSPARCS